MKPQLEHVAIVTATLDPARAADCFQSWLGRSTYHLPVYVVWGDVHGFKQREQPLTKLERHIWEDHCRLGTRTILDAFAPGVTMLNHQGGGVVPAFNLGVQRAIKDGALTVICLHDDLLIEEDGWDLQVIGADPTATFMGFGGATQLGCASLYVEPYDPMQLARGGFVSNMRDAEAHGRRSSVPVPCVCFDGFSQIGTGAWFGEAWQSMVDLGFRHHWYDGALGCYAKRAKQKGLMIPVKCHHFGGRTAVGDQGYQAWAKTQHPEGDQGFWLEAHKIGYESFKDVLPLQVGR